MQYITNGSWKTTSAGILSIAGGLVGLAFALKAKALTEEAVMAAITAIVAGVGLLCARDNDKTSEQAKAGPNGKTNGKDKPL